MEAMAETSTRPHRQLHPVLTVLAMILFAAFLTHVLPAGHFERRDGKVVPGSYTEVSKENGLAAIVAPTPPRTEDGTARAAGVVAVITSIPAGMTERAELIFMVMFVGGAFGILRATGVIDAGVDRLLYLTSGNVYLLTAGLMLLLSSGSTFLGFSSEYVALIPVVMALGQRLGLPNLFAPAVVALADFVGYSASVTNPILLGVAQPLAGVQVFSGILPRLVIFAILFGIGVGYVLLYLRRLPKLEYLPEATRLSVRQTGVAVTLLLGGVGLVAGTGRWDWGTSEHASAFLALALAVAIVGGLRAGQAADAFLDGCRTMLLPCLLIGLASAIGLILQYSQVMDSVVNGFATRIEGHDRGVIAIAMMGAEMIFGVLIASGSAKAAISVPILAPIGHLAGLDGNGTVTALLLGSGMTNMIAPSGLLLAFLAASKVGYGEWVRFIAPLFAAMTVLSFGALYLIATAS